MNRFREYIGVVQARTGSSRLPGKMLMNVCGETIISIMLKRMKYSKKVSRWILATTNIPGDIELVEIAKALKIPYFCGSENDLLDRMYQCATEYGIECMVRVGGDNPLLDPRIIDQTLESFDNGHIEYDYFSNHHPPTFPDGQEVEIIPYKSLRISWEESVLPYEREHGTPFLWDHPDRFSIGNYEYAGSSLYRTNRWTLDYPEDFEMISAVFESLYSRKPDFGMEDVLTLLKEKPQIALMNRIHQGKTWHLAEEGKLATISQYKVNP